MSEKTIKSIVLCADDFGLNAPVSQGIIALAVLGRISATSALVYSPRWQHDAVALSEMRERLDVGVHLDWTSPMAQGAGYGMHRSVAVAMSSLGIASKKRVREDIERQLDRFEKYWKAMPDHISGYDQVYQMRGWRNVLCDVLAQRYGTRNHKPWLRPAGLVQQIWRKRWYNTLGGAALTRWSEQQSWPLARPLLGVYDYRGGIGDYGRFMQQWLTLVPDQPQGFAVVMCHPALSAQMGDAIGVARSREFAYLVGHDFVQHLRDAGLRLVRGSGQPMVLG